MFFFNFDRGVNFYGENVCGYFFAGIFFSLLIVKKTTKIAKTRTRKNLAAHGTQGAVV